jgi:hypothetical protein
MVLALCVRADENHWSGAGCAKDPMVQFEQTCCSAPENHRLSSVCPWCTAGWREIHQTSRLLVCSNSSLRGKSMSVSLEHGLNHLLAMCRHTFLALVEHWRSRVMDAILVWIDKGLATTFVDALGCHRWAVWQEVELGCRDGEGEGKGEGEGGNEQRSAWNTDYKGSADSKRGPYVRWTDCKAGRSMEGVVVGGLLCQRPALPGGDNNASSRTYVLQTALRLWEGLFFSCAPARSLGRSSSTRAGRPCHKIPD